LSAFISLFLGSFGGVNAFNFKEFVAYSSLSQLGFITLSLAAHNLVAAASAGFFFFYYCVSMVAIFLILSFFAEFESLTITVKDSEIDLSKLDIKSVSSKQNILKELDGGRAQWRSIEYEKYLSTRTRNLISEKILYLCQLKSIVSEKGKVLVLGFNSLRLFSTSPAVSFCFSIALLNLAGIPPFPGFFAKFYILYGLMQKGLHFYAMLALFFSLFSIFYYIRLLMLLWVDTVENIKKGTSKDEQTSVSFKEAAGHEHTATYIDYFFSSFIRSSNRLAILGLGFCLFLIICGPLFMDTT